MICKYCGHENTSPVKFCNECGKQIRGDKIDYNDENKKYFVGTLVLFLCIVLIIVLSHVSELPLLKHEYVFNGLLVLTTLVFIVREPKSFFRLFRFSFHIRPILFVLIGAPVLAFFVILLANSMNQKLGLENSSYYETFLLNTSNSVVYGLFFIALMPGILEEFLFRGILFNHLLKLTTPKLTIIITGILFAFIHFAFLSLIWLGLIGLFLGYLRFRYRTIVYGIFFHILYNGSVFLLEMVL